MTASGRPTISQLARSIDDPSGRRALYQKFFQRLIDDLREQHDFTGAQIGGARNWQSFASGVPGFTYAVAFAAGSRCRAEIYIDLGSRSRNLTAFQTLRTDELVLGKALREPLKWEILEGRRACRIATYRLASIDDSAHSLQEYHRWAVDRLLLFRKVFGSRLAAAAGRF